MCFKVCGICGVIGHSSLYRCVNISLAQLDRGKLGSGYGWINNSGKMWFIKAPVNPLKLAMISRYFIGNTAKYAIGHNRQPSHGSVSKENCHPFIDCKNRFALVHNGSITWNQETLNTIKKKHKIHGETDSEILTHGICEKLNNGLTIKNALEDLIKENITETIILLTKEKELYAIKDFMPLWLCQIKNSIKGDFSILASEKQAIETAFLDILTKKTPNLEVKYTDLDSGDLIHINSEHELTIYKHETLPVYKTAKWNTQDYYTGINQYWEFDPINGWQRTATKKENKKIKSDYPLSNYGWE